MNVRLLSNKELIESIYILNTLYIETFNSEIVNLFNQIEEEISFRRKNNLNSGYTDI